MSKKRVTVDLETCKGYANCVMEAPDVFDIDIDTDAGRSVVLQEFPSGDALEYAESAARICPAQAITVAEG